ncbi:transcription activator of gluconeogenesis ERT1, partial [Striga asiatica]
LCILVNPNQMRNQKFLPSTINYDPSLSISLSLKSVNHRRPAADHRNRPTSLVLPDPVCRCLILLTGEDNIDHPVAQCPCKYIHLMAPKARKEFFYHQLEVLRVKEKLIPQKINCRRRQAL